MLDKWFQSTHSLRSATGGGEKMKTGKRFQSTHSLRSATNAFIFRRRAGKVSIHALLAECDAHDPQFPHPAFSFQSTHSLRSATGRVRYFFRRDEFQSTHSLRSATDFVGNGRKMLFVSIHALLAECDRMPGNGLPANAGFQSTHSLRSATAQVVQRQFFQYRFNPRTPCGVRLSFKARASMKKRFQSTHSLRSATAPNLIHCYSTKQIILCANLPKKTVIARLLFLSIYLSIFYSQCITPIADLPGNSCELEVGAQAMFNSL